MTLLDFIFYFFESVVALSAISLLFVKNIFHAALALLICLLAIAALFILSNAEFVAVSQLLIYAGGVVVLIIFGIMLTNKSGGQPIPIANTGLYGGLFVGSATFFLFVFFVRNQLFIVHNASPTDNTYNNIQGVGIALLTNYVLPFEIAGVLLLAVLAGAATVAGYKSTKI